MPVLRVTKSRAGTRKLINRTACELKGFISVTLLRKCVSPAQKSPKTKFNGRRSNHAPLYLPLWAKIYIIRGSNLAVSSANLLMLRLPL